MFIILPLGASLPRVPPVHIALPCIMLHLRHLGADFVGGQNGLTLVSARYRRLLHFVHLGIRIIDLILIGFDALAEEIFGVAAVENGHSRLLAADARADLQERKVFATIAAGAWQL